MDWTLLQKQQVVKLTGETSSLLLHQANRLLSSEETSHVQGSDCDSAPMFAIAVCVLANYYLAIVSAHRWHPNMIWEWDCT